MHDDCSQKGEHKKRQRQGAGLPAQHQQDATAEFERNRQHQQRLRGGQTKITDKSRSRRKGLQFASFN